MTITSFAGEEPPVFSSIDLNNVSGVVFSKLKVAYGATQAPSSTYAVNMFNGADIVLEQMEISSAEDGVDGNDAIAVFIRNSARVSVSDSLMHDVFRGVAVFDSDDTVIRRNIIAGVGSDGVVGRGVVRLKILDNYFADFAIIGEAHLHPDAIQLWTRGAMRASQGIEIVGNTIRRGSGDPSQGILISGTEFATDDLLIADNVIEQSMGQGIAISNSGNVTIRDNTVIPHDFYHDAPAIDVRELAGNVTVSSNIAMAYRLDASVVAIGNVKADYYNPWIADFIGNYLVDPADPSEPLDFEALTPAGAFAYARDVWLGDQGAPPGSLTPPATVVDFDFTSVPTDRAPDPVSISLAIDKFGADYFSTGVAPKLTAALNLRIEARCKLPSVAAGYRYVAAVPSSYDLRIDRDRVLFSVWTASGITRLSAVAPAMLDLSAHDLTAAYDGTAGLMIVSVDGIEIARRAAPTGPIAYFPSYKLYAGGSPWGGSFGGGLETLKISR
ncbi:MAG: right-handed parallel beta-helix repeat-containing protein [Pseudomonadota bacterium]